MNATAKRPKTKAAKNVKRGDWIQVGNMAYLVHDDARDNGDGTVFLPIGYSGSEYRADARVTMHYED
jgi:hypothetical protein